MRHNQNIKLIGEKVILIPYKKTHVEKYHAWMQDPEILRLTGSEPLTLQKEYAMQRSWRRDSDKLTFIVLAKDRVDAELEEIECMIGDVNIFFNFKEREGEVEIMIADKTARRQGYGFEAVKLMLSYAQKTFDMNKFFAKIVRDNEACLNMFEKKLLFRKVKFSEIFGEWELRLTDEGALACDDIIDNLNEMMKPYNPERALIEKAAISPDAAKEYELQNGKLVDVTYPDPAHATSYVEEEEEVESPETPPEEPPEVDYEELERQMTDLCGPTPHYTYDESKVPQETINRFALSAIEQFKASKATTSREVEKPVEEPKDELDRFREQHMNAPPENTDWFVEEKPVNKDEEYYVSPYKTSPPRPYDPDAVRISRHFPHDDEEQEEEVEEGNDEEQEEDNDQDN